MLWARDLDNTCCSETGPVEFSDSFTISEESMQQTVNIDHS